MPSTKWEFSSSGFCRVFAGLHRPGFLRSVDFYWYEGLSTQAILGLWHFVHLIQPVHQISEDDTCKDYFYAIEELYIFYAIAYADSIWQLQQATRVDLASAFSVTFLIMCIQTTRAISLQFRYCLSTHLYLPHISRISPLQKKRSRLVLWQVNSGAVVACGNSFQ